MERTERTGEGRRMADGHCADHADRMKEQERQGQENAAVRANGKLLLSIAGFALAISMSIVGFIMRTTVDSIRDVNTSVKEVKTLVQNSDITLGRFGVRMDNMEQDVKELKAVNPRMRSRE